MAASVKYPELLFQVASIVGGNIRQVRKHKRIRLKDFAATTGLGYSALADIENGEHQPRLHHLFIIAHHLDVPVTRLLPATPLTIPEPPQ